MARINLIRRLVMFLVACTVLADCRCESKRETPDSQHR